MDVLGAILVELGVDMNPLKQGFKRAISDAKTAGDSAGSAFGVGFNSRLLNAVAGIGDAVAGAKQSFDFLENVSGSRFAAEMGGYRRALLGISGDAGKAERALKMFQSTAASSQFDAGATARFGINLAGRTGDVIGAAKDTQRAVDAAQIIGVDRSHFDAFQVNLAQIQNRGNNQVEMPDLQQLRDYAPMLTSAVAKAFNISVQDASKKIASSTGTQLSDLILGIGEKNKGAAAAASGNDPYGAAANVVDSFNIAMAPTGQALNDAILPLVKDIGWLTDRFGDLNKATGGSAGLIATIGIGSVIFRKVKSEFDNTISSVTRLTSAVDTLADRAGNATVKLGSATARFDAGNANVPGSTETPTNWKMMALQATPYAIGIAGSVATAIANNTGNQRLGRQLGDATNYSQLGGVGGSAIGAIAGAIIGSVVPGLGTAAGATAGSAIGGAVGSIAGFGVGAYQGGESYDKENKTADAQEKAAKAAEDLATVLDKTKFTALGGGSRVASEASALEAEYAMVRLMRTGLSG